VICIHCHHTGPPSSECPGCGADPLLEGHYRLEAELGSGAAGTLYRAIDTQTGDPVAIKERHPAGRLSAEDASLFDREVKVLRELRHPRIPRYHDAFASGTGRARRHYLVQELVDGRSLDAELAERRLSEAEVLEIIAELAAILHYLHGLAPPVVHRDLKPGNVMRRVDGQLVLVDFGAVRAELPGTFGGQTVAGTFGYMAPEQFMGEACPKSDVYALGALAVALLSRRDPGELRDRLGVFSWAGAISVSDQTQGLLRLMLDEEPSGRPTAAEVIEQLGSSGAKTPAPEQDKKAKKRSRDRDRPKDRSRGKHKAKSKKRSRKQRAHDTPRGQDTPRGGEELTALAARGRHKQQRSAAKAARRALREAASKDAAADKRLREALVGPFLSLLLRYQMVLTYGAVFTSLLGGGFVLSLLAPMLEDWVPWSAMLMLVSLGMVIGPLIVVLSVKSYAMKLACRLANRRELARLEAAEVPILIDGYLNHLAAFHHSAQAVVHLQTGEPPSDRLCSTLRHALEGANLGGSVSRTRTGLKLKSPTLDLTSFHGKRLEHVISHHSLIHRWICRALDRVVLPAGGNLRLQSIRLAVEE